MRAGMWIAIVLGVIALIVGIAIAFVFGAASGVAGALGESDTAAAGGIVVLVLIGMPLMAIIGGALALSNPRAARFLTGIPGVLIAMLGLLDPEKGVAVIILGAGLVLAAALIHRGYQAGRETDSGQSA